MLNYVMMEKNHEVYHQKNGRFFYIEKIIHFEWKLDG
jgi:hypothetical protein